MTNPFILTLDNGNSNPHLGYFRRDGQLERVQPLNREQPLVQQVPAASTAPIIIASVGNESTYNLSALPNPIIRTNDFFQDHSFLNMPVNYSATLGIDRLVQAFHLFLQHQNGSAYEKIIMLVDSGTFATIDFISTHKGFLGGYIIPGPQLLQNCYQRGRQLKTTDCTLTSWQHIDPFTGLPTQTDHAITYGMLGLLSGMLKELLAKQQPELIYCTGGGGAIWQAQTERLIQQVALTTTVVYEPHLIHLALFTIYQHQEK